MIYKVYLCMIAEIDVVCELSCSLIYSFMDEPSIKDMMKNST